MLSVLTTAVLFHRSQHLLISQTKASFPSGIHPALNDSEPECPLSHPPGDFCDLTLLENSTLVNPSHLPSQFFLVTTQDPLTFSHLSFFFFFFCLLSFQGLHLWHMEVSRGLIGAVAAKPMPEPQQCQIQAPSTTYTTALGNDGSLTH